jgi:hypothetical protein
VSTRETFSKSTCVEQIEMAERELASFLGAVTEFYGPEQAGPSADDWLEQCEVMDNPPRYTRRDWRAVTIAAAARLALRLTVAQRHRTSLRTPLAPSTDTKVPPIPSSNCFSRALLV